MSSSPGEVQASDVGLPPVPPKPPGEVQASVVDLPLVPPPPPIPTKPPGEVQASDADLPTLPPKPPRIHVLISKDQARISLPLRAALLSYKIKFHGPGTSETRCAIDAATLAKIVPYMIRHSGCTDADNPPMTAAELMEWDHSVFLKEPDRILLSMLHAALWLQIPRIALLIESKLAPTDQNN